MDAEVLVRAKCEVGEAPVWVAEQQGLIWVDIPAGHVHRFHLPTGRSELILEMGEPVGSVVPRVSGGFLVAAASGFLTIDGERWRARRIADFKRQRVAMQLNDGKCDADGRFWVGTVPRTRGEAPGSLLCLDADRRVRPILDGIRMANGMGWTSDQRSFYLVDSIRHRIDRWDFEPGRGKISSRRPFVHVPEGLPDGLAVDAENCIWIAVWGEGRVIRIAPSGRRCETIHVPVRKVSSCAFAGDDLRLLVITTARQGLSPSERRRQDAAGSIFAIRVQTPGLPTHSYAG